MKLNKSYVEYVGKMHSLSKENSNETISFTVKASTKKNVEAAIAHLEGSYDVDSLISCLLDDIASHLLQLPKQRKTRGTKTPTTQTDNVVQGNFPKTGSDTP